MSWTGTIHVEVPVRVAIDIYASQRFAHVDDAKDYAEQEARQIIEMQLERLAGLAGRSIGPVDTEIISVEEDQEP